MSSPAPSRVSPIYGRVLTLGFLLTLSPALPAQTARDQWTGNIWREKMRTIDQLLYGREFRRAEREIDRLIPEMADRIAGGEGASSFLATATLLRAIAEAGQGNEFDARWDYSMAASLEPAFEKMRFDSYGPEVAKILYPEYLQEEVGPPEGVDEILPVTPPEKTTAPQPEYPYSHRLRCITGPVQVAAVIGVDGIPSHPRLENNDYPVFGFAAMDQLRRWRFRPARWGDQPVAVHYRLSVNFKIKGC